MGGKVPQNILLYSSRKKNDKIIKKTSDTIGNNEVTFRTGRVQNKFLGFRGYTIIQYIVSLF